MYRFFENTLLFLTMLGIGISITYKLATSKASWKAKAKQARKVNDAVRKANDVHNRVILDDDYRSRLRDEFRD